MRMIGVRGARTEPPDVLRIGATALALMLAAGPALTDEVFTFVALGDTAYDVPADIPHYQALIAAINEIEPAFSIHIGDIQDSEDPCTDEVLERNAELFRTYDHPVVYTPGDNEWTDCHETGGDPLPRLNVIRAWFFAEPRSLGGRPMIVERQSDVPGYELFVENLRWRWQKVVFATLHAVGSNNNRQRGARGAVAEYEKRDEANVAWIEEAFQLATKEGMQAVVLSFQANPFKKKSKRKSGFVNTLDAIREGAARFEGEVLLIHGDSHDFIIDRPFAVDAEEREPPLGNITRLQVFGSPELKAVEVTVDQARPSLFTFAQIRP